MLQLLAVAVLLFLGDDPATAQTPAVTRRPTAADRRLAEKWLAYRLRLQKNYRSVADGMEIIAVREAGLVQTNRDPSALKAGVVPAPPLDFPLVAGAIGTLHGGTFKVLERLGDKEARVDIYRPPSPEEAQQYFQESVRDTPKLDTVDVFLTNYDVAAMADDQSYRTSACFVVTKTKTYTTALGGTRTIFVIEPYDSSAAQSIFTKAVQEELETEKKIAGAREKEAKERASAQQHAKTEHDRDMQKKRYPALLKNARALISAKLYAAAEKMLRRIIDEAPDTDAAKEARKELDALPAH